MLRALAIVFSLAAAIAPRGSSEPSSATTIRVLTFNTKLGGESPWSPSEQIAAIAGARPDVVMLQEALYLQLDQYTKGIATALRDPNWSGKYARHCKHATARQCDTYGAESVMLLTRLPIVDSEARLIWAADDAWMARGVVRAAIKVGDRVVLQAFSCHLPASGKEARSRTVWVAGFRRWAATLPEPQIVGGDFNDVPASQAIAAIRRSYVDAWRATGGARGGTESSDDLTYSRRFDYLFSRGAVEVESATVLPLKISDHRPVVATYRISFPSR
jgi:endonuclease/exonuclease/phosphatase family metal-dependent hydrolase